MKAVLVNYTLERASSKERMALQRELNGYNDNSNNGRYHYRREGVINEKGVIKLNRGVIIAESKMKNKIISLLKKNKASIRSIDITLNSSEFK